LTLILTAASVVFAFYYTYVLEMGIYGLGYALAFATGVSLVVSLALMHLSRNKENVQIRTPHFIREDTAAVFSLGSPPGLSRLYRFVSLFLLNFILLSAIGAEAVAIFSALNMLLRFVTAFATGISGVQIPIAGVLREERDEMSLRQLARAVFSYGNIVIIFAVVSALVLHNGIASLFGITGGMFLPALACFGVYMLFYINGNLSISWYTAVRKVKLANLITLGQDLVFPVLLIIIFAAIGGNAIWLHMPATGLFTAILLLLTYKYGKEELETGGSVLAFSVQRDAAKASEASAAVSDFCEEQSLSMKQGMLLALAVEELIALSAEQNAQGGDISVRLMIFGDSIILRLRDAGHKFNPLDYCEKNQTDDIEDNIGLMGVKYIKETAEVVYYRETFGVNNLVVII